MAVFVFVFVFVFVIVIVFVFVIVFVDKGTTSFFAFPTKCNRLQQIATDCNRNFASDFISVK